MVESRGRPTPFQAEFTTSTHSALADAPVAKGGGGEGFGPHELLEAALATCLSMTAQMTAAKHGFPLTGVRSRVAIDRTDPDRAVLNYSLDLDGPLTPEQTAAIREAAAGCPVGRTLLGTVTLRADAG